MITKNKHVVEIWIGDNIYAPFSILRKGTYGAISEYSLKLLYIYYIKLLYENNKS